MEYSININKIFILFVMFNLFGKIYDLLNFNYPSAITLTNKNVFIVEMDGIFVFDKNLKNIIYSYSFEDSEKISNTEILSRVVIKPERSHIICLINGKIFFFDYEGKFLTKTSKLITEQRNYHTDLVPIPLGDANSYYYVISYFIEDSGSYKQKVLYYKINLIDKSNNLIQSKTLNKMEEKAWVGYGTDTYTFDNKGLSCEYMQCENKAQYIYLVCFLTIKKDEDVCTVSLNYFELSINSININKKFYSSFINYNNPITVKLIKTVVKSDMKTSLVCILLSTGKLECYKFHFVYGTITDTIEFYDKYEPNFSCRISTYSMKLNYLADGKKISLSCIYIGSKTTVQAKMFDENLNSIEKSYTQFTNCQTIYGHSIVQSDSEYYIVSDVICGNYKRCYEPLEGELSPIIIIITTQIIENDEEEEKENEKEKREEEKETEERKKEEESEEKQEKEEELEKRKENYEDKKEEEMEEIREKEIKEEHLEEEKKLEEEKIIETNFDCGNYLEKCEECDKDSLSKNLYIKCNHEKNYYYLNYYPLQS